MAFFSGEGGATDRVSYTSYVRSWLPRAKRCTLPECFVYNPDRHIHVPRVKNTLPLPKLQSGFFSSPCGNLERVDTYFLPSSIEKDYILLPCDCCMSDVPGMSPSQKRRAGTKNRLVPFISTITARKPFEVKVTRMGGELKQTIHHTVAS